MRYASTTYQLVHDLRLTLTLSFKSLGIVFLLGVYDILFVPTCRQIFLAIDGALEQFNDLFSPIEYQQSTICQLVSWNRHVEPTFHS